MAQNPCPEGLNPRARLVSHNPAESGSGGRLGCDRLCWPLALLVPALPSGDTQQQKFLVAPGLAGGLCTPGWDPQGTGSLPQARVENETRDKHRDSQGDRCSPKDPRCSPSSELVLQGQTISLAAHSLNAAPYCSSTRHIHFPSSILFVLICCPQSDRPGDIIYILHRSRDYSPRVWETRCWTHTHTKSLHEHVIGFPGCGAILKRCCVCHFGIKLM